jgi:hypothetical protein
MRQQGGDFSQERVRENGGDFLFAPASGIPDKLADVDLESVGEPLKGAQSWDRLAVFDFRNISPWHLHAAGELALAQVARLADFAHLPGNLQPGLGRSRRGRGTGHQLWGGWSRLLDVEGLVAFSAKGVSGAVLNQAAEIATHDFACFHAHQGGSHRLCAERQSWISGVLFCTAICATFGEMNHNCQVQT